MPGRVALQPIAKESAPSPDDTALQLYSSGTTGLPKGVELTHGNLAAGMMSAVPDAIGYRGAPDVMLNVLPTYHIAGVGVGLLTATRGGASVLYPDFDPALAVAAIGEHRITHAFLVPAMIQFMLQAAGADKADYSSLKGISYGASPISEKVLVDALRTFKCDFMQVYGLTETTGAITMLPPEDHDPDGPKKHLLRSAGKPIDERGAARGRARRRQGLRRGRGGRSVDPQPAEHEGLLGQPQGDRQRLHGRRLVPLGRRGVPEGRVPLPARPHQGHDHLGRREHLPGGSGERADAAPGARRRRGDRRARRHLGRGGQGLRGAQARGQGERRGDHRVHAHAHRALQVPEDRSTSSRRSRAIPPARS